MFITKRLSLVMFTMTAFLCISGLGLYMFYLWSFEQGVRHNPPVILADRTPFKISPMDPGGKHVPHQDKHIYDQLPSGLSRQSVGVLAPQSERDIARPDRMSIPQEELPRIIETDDTGQIRVQGHKVALDDSAVVSALSQAPGHPVTPDPPGQTVQTAQILNETQTAVASVSGSGLSDPDLSDPDGDTRIDQMVSVSGSEGTYSPASVNGLVTQPVNTDSDPVTATYESLDSLISDISDADDPGPVVTGPTAESPSQVVPLQVAASVPDARPVETRSETQGQEKIADTRTVTAHASGPYFAQLGSFSQPETAEKNWRRLISLHSNILSTLDHRIYPIDLADQGVYHRLLAGGFASKDAAKAVCDAMIRNKEKCLVNRID